MSALLLAFALLPTGTPSPAPKATPAPPPVIGGVVRGPAGAPLKDALVSVVPLRSERWGGPDEQPLEARTDAEGRFRVTLRASRPVEVRISAQGLAPKTIDRAIPGRPIDVTLAKGRSVEGTVRDAVSGDPVGGVRVAVGAVPFWGFGSEPRLGANETRTDGKGRFRLGGLGTAPISLAASAPGYALASRAGVKAGSRVELLLLPGLSIRGLVLGPDGKGVPEAKVVAEPDLPTASLAGPVTSDANGRFALAGVTPGTYRVFGHAPKLGASLVEEVSVEAGSDARVDLRLGPASDVVGRAVGPDHKPVPANVVATDLDGHAAAAIPAALHAEAAPDGRFRLSGLPPGSHALRVTSPGFAPKRVEANVAGDEPQATLDLGDVELERGLTIRGRVEDEARQPVANASIVGRFQGDLGDDLTPHARSESDGSFILAGLTAGRYTLEVRAPGYGEARPDAEAGADKLVVTLRPAGTIAGQVVDDDGKPIEAFRVSARSMHLGRSVSFRSAPTVEASDGRFKIEDLAEGTYLVEAFAAERQPGVAKDVAVKPGATTDVGRIRLAAGGTIMGSVVDGRGAPIASATLTVVGPGRGMGTRAQGTSDLGGAFEIHGVPVGTLSVSASHPAFADARADGVVVDPAQGPGRARIVMQAGGRIEGFARQRNGAGIPGAYVSATVAEARPGDFLATAAPVSAADGSFALEHVPAGRVAVRLADHWGDTFSMGEPRDAKDVVVADGETTVVEFQTRDVLVSGRVTRRGEPLGAVRVSAGSVIHGSGGVAPGSAGEPQRGFAVTAPDGSYALIATFPGKTWFNVASLDWSQNYVSRTIDVPDAEAFALDFTVGGAPVSGIVVDAATEEPIASASVFADPKAGGEGTAGDDTHADGRFAFEVEPGDYKLLAYAPGHVRATRDVSVAGEGLTDLRLALSAGQQIAGKVVDASGRGIGGIGVAGIAGDPSSKDASRAWTMALPDGSFILEGLRDQPYDVSAGDALAGFGALAQVRPGEKDAVVSLRPGGRLRLMVRGPDGLPAAAALARVDRAFGAALARGPAFSTSPAGSLEMAVPQGPIELRVSTDDALARASVSVPEGGLASLEVQLQPASPH